MTEYYSFEKHLHQDIIDKNLPDLSRILDFLFARFFILDKATVRLMVL